MIKEFFLASALFYFPPKFIYYRIQSVKADFLIFTATVYVFFNRFIVHSFIRYLFLKFLAILLTYIIFNKILWLVLALFYYIIKPLNGDHLFFNHFYQQFFGWVALFLSCLPLLDLQTPKYKNSYLHFL